MNLNCILLLEEGLGKYIQLDKRSFKDPYLPRGSTYAFV